MFFLVQWNCFLVVRKSCRRGDILKADTKPQYDSVFMPPNGVATSQQAEWQPFTMKQGFYYNGAASRLQKKKTSPTLLCVRDA